MKRLNENKGITLIALVITIIVMLILVGVTVNVALNGGLFEAAKEATTKQEIDIIREIAWTSSIDNIEGNPNISKIVNALNNSGYQAEKNIYGIDVNGEYRVTVDIDGNIDVQKISEEMPKGNLQFGKYYTCENFNYYSNHYGTLKVIFFENGVVQFESKNHEEGRRSGNIYLMFYNCIYSIENQEVSTTLFGDEEGVGKFVFKLNEEGNAVTAINAIADGYERPVYENLQDLVITEEEFNYANKDANAGIYYNVPYISEEGNMIVIGENGYLALGHHELYSELGLEGEGLLYPVDDITINSDGTIKMGSETITIIDENTLVWNEETFVRNPEFDWNKFEK